MSDSDMFEVYLSYSHRTLKGQHGLLASPVWYTMAGCTFIPCLGVYFNYLYVCMLYMYVSRYVCGRHR